MKKQDIIFGIHAVEALLSNSPERVIEVWVLQGRDDERLLPLIKKATEFGVSVQSSGRKVLDDKASSTQHQGIVARVKAAKILAEADLDALLEKTDLPFLLILDGVTDPHNLGACLRNADAAGVQGIIVPKDNSVGLTSIVSKVACGAAETIPLFQVTNLARTMRHIQQKGVWIIGAAGEADCELYQADLKGPLAIAMGAEDKGLRRLTRESCDSIVSIPMAGSVSSLNVSVATGICLFEAVRQRLVK
ncbi:MULTISPECIES: 23S rRNA (guanosine(2251)-2'-O)-methyltransferase RlmB [unclassified Shewanella]|uniref:23S rRNA (guanosine(2251)-2'-O)-methyltransferase RlmB n=1 Tax=unclassified Shewanella TaxID=196818 RepID=UPI000C85215D|nr:MULTISPECIES: 23S rRNA (guanosine(2251)-2'-O)-methyltransferase RlmB [unclassified Shewanella]MDO6619355.1 23S rRNA (guanosine(2251)-2'-O)-methyltransferase RlmB [Shewanella sp. 6_MG-2023]MDO6641405.1 23S rRNA (guanosine(2251)-2'-O)-methyltransferase RlmB [Shewanella sp. 5_MG-2023]MDO6679767.1 23S rRNA (guanosine(2251)-2'-O)-methyltransferase RlmB [Shewanella sp. 4_MG-2023]MDO6776678.1 23S rRNA (guanosine(2251)-2'-O)-methyltransferase RlmB [Shewanella sp. 3_MG-2023]PMG30648.1 23S rRNA (guan